MYFTQKNLLKTQNLCISIRQTGEIELKDWYTRQEVADILGISKATVYHYAKQKKIIKIANPHRLIREVRYKQEEVDALADRTPTPPADGSSAF